MVTSAAEANQGFEELHRSSLRAGESGVEKTQR